MFVLGASSSFQPSQQRWVWLTHPGLIPPGGSRRSSRSSPGTSHSHRPAVPHLAGVTEPPPCQDLPVNPTGTNGGTTKMLQPNPGHPSLKTSKMSLPSRSHQSSGFEQRRDQLPWGQEKAQPSSEWSHSGQGCSDTLQTKPMIPHTSAGAFYPHHTK